MRAPSYWLHFCSIIKVKSHYHNQLKAAHVFTFAHSRIRWLNSLVVPRREAMSGESPSGRLAAGPRTRRQFNNASIRCSAGGHGSGLSAVCHFIRLSCHLSTGRCLPYLLSFVHLPRTPQPQCKILAK